jgi:hypothetical protein
VLSGVIFVKTNICPKDGCDMIAEAVLIAEEPSTKKESGAESAATYLSINAFNLKARHPLKRFLSIYPIMDIRH